MRQERFLESFKSTYFFQKSASPYDCGVGERAPDLESDELGAEC